MCEFPLLTWLLTMAEAQSHPTTGGIGVLTDSTTVRHGLTRTTRNHSGFERFRWITTLSIHSRFTVAGSTVNVWRQPILVCCAGLHRCNASERCTSPAFEDDDGSTISDWTQDEASTWATTHASSNRQPMAYLGNCGELAVRNRTTYRPTPRVHFRYSDGRGFQH